MARKLHPRRGRWVPAWITLMLCLVLCTLDFSPLRAGAPRTRPSHLGMLRPALPYQCGAWQGRDVRNPIEGLILPGGDRGVSRAYEHAATGGRMVVLIQPCQGLAELRANWHANFLAAEGWQVQSSAVQTWPLGQRQLSVSHCRYRARLATGSATIQVAAFIVLGDGRVVATLEQALSRVSGNPALTHNAMQVYLLLMPADAPRTAQRNAGWATGLIEPELRALTQGGLP